MVPCAYCERPLTCDACQASFQPTDPDTYRAVSWSDHVIHCTTCGAVLVCHWCKTAYDGDTTTPAGEPPE